MIAQSSSMTMAHTYLGNAAYYLTRFRIGLSAVFSVSVLLVFILTTSQSISALSFPIHFLLAVPVIAALGYVIYCYAKFRYFRNSLNRFNQFNDGVTELVKTGSASALRNFFFVGSKRLQSNQIVNLFVSDVSVRIEHVIKEKHQAELKQQLEAEYERFEKSISSKLAKLKNEHPLYKARGALLEAIAHLQNRRADLKTQWELRYEQFSWWNKIKYSGGPNFHDIDKLISDLEYSLLRLNAEKESDFEKLDDYFSTVGERAVKRVAAVKALSDAYVLQSHIDDVLGSDLLQVGLLLSVMSIPISVWNDVSQAADVYDALRSVNGGFAEMSNADIWWQTLFMPAESLQGLTNLTKGAYFEQLVAADSGGQLFEHFNHANTDIVIDGIEYQLKATDSAGYINSVAEGVPVISTSEVAERTSAIDSGYSNEQLTHDVELAIGGSVVDGPDTILTALFVGVGSLGFFATLEGLDHAVKKYENGGDSVEALFEGAGIAIEGTARAMVNFSELLFNIATCRPVLAVIRFFFNVVVKLGGKLVGVEHKRN